MMKIWRYVPIILLILLCGAVTAEEMVFTPTGGTGEEIQAGNISFSTPVSETSGITILSVSQNPDEYTVSNVVTVDVNKFDLLLSSPT